jgi:hypothetical protein
VCNGRFCPENIENVEYLYFEYKLAKCMLLSLFIRGGELVNTQEMLNITPCVNESALCVHQERGATTPRHVRQTVI